MKGSEVGGWLSTPSVILILGIVLVSSDSARSAALSADGPPIDSKLLQLAESNRMILFGELHGTREMPAYFAAVVSELARHDRAVKVGIEHPVGQTEDLNQYLKSPGDKQARQWLLNNRYWNAAHQDGRTSRAMFLLLEQLRILKTAGRDIELFSFDDQQSADRDKGLAANIIQAYEKAPDTLFLVLTGNIHSRLKKGTPWNPEFKTMGYYLRQQTSLTLTSVEFTNEGGWAWMCAPDCQTTQLMPPKIPVERFALVKKPPAYHHDYAVNIGAITASMPAASK